jgi:hypothetical protein
MQVSGFLPVFLLQGFEVSKNDSFEEYLDIVITAY